MRTSLRNLISFTVLVMATSAFAAASDHPAGQSSLMPSGHEATTKSEQKPSVGIMSGITDTHDNRRNGTSWGIEAGYQPYVPFGVALQLSGYVSDHKEEMPTLTRTILLAKVNYNLGGDIPVIKDSYFGLGLGPVMDNVANTIDTELGVAPQIGFDIPLGPEPATFSLGANANYMFVGGSKPDVFALNGVAKYWF